MTNEQEINKINKWTNKIKEKNTRKEYEKFLHAHTRTIKPLNWDPEHIWYSSKRSLS